MLFYKQKIQVLFVCTANICRSPLAEGLMRHQLREKGLHKYFQTDSAGTHASQSGHKPDVRAQRIAAAAGVSLKGIKARQVTLKDMVRSDYIIAMDTSNYRKLSKLCPPEHRNKIKKLMSFAPCSAVEDVPDPYYGNFSGFEEVFRLVDTGVTGLLASVKEQRECNTFSSKGFS